MLLLHLVGCLYYYTADGLGTNVVMFLLYPSPRIRVFRFEKRARTTLERSKWWIPFIRYKLNESLR